MTAWAKLKRRLFAPADLHPGQVEELLDHARRSGMDNVLHLLHLLEDRHGHRRSAREQAPVDGEGAPLPWFTYPAIAYLQGLDLKDKSVFEYGAGFGSLFFAQRARRVVSVENDQEWHARVAAFETPADVRPTVLLRQDEDDYVDAVRDGVWDVIVIDGAWRRRCARAALAHLAPTGFLILDNADWYPHTAADLRAADLLQVDFSGLGPVNYYTWTTSLFFRRGAQLTPRAGVQPAAGIGSMPQIVDE